jgi:hypothetical protein
MAAGQFTVYSSGDIGSPQLTGTSASLISVLDGVLVNGYGSKAGAGWLAEDQQLLVRGPFLRSLSRLSSDGRFGWGSVLMSS